MRKRICTIEAFSLGLVIAGGAALGLIVLAVVLTR
jgi:hypothetical protein